MLRLRRFFAASLTILSGCTHSTILNVVPYRHPKEFCDAAKPMDHALADTLLTIEEIKRYNALGKTLCGWGISQDDH